MANIGGSDIPHPDAGELAFYQDIICCVHIYAPTTVYALPAHAAVESSSDSDPVQLPRDSPTLPSHLSLIDLESLKRKRRGKRRAILEWSLRKLRRLLGKLT